MLNFENYMILYSIKPGIENRIENDKMTSILWIEHAYFLKNIDISFKLDVIYSCMRKICEKFLNLVTGLLHLMKCDSSRQTVKEIKKKKITYP